MSNRLIKEDSPYLQQHANNPVDWYPWCDEAFEVAKKYKKAIFISIGYSSCHWCHVMEHEVFEDEEIAKLLNKDFICIKVDREERPDLDQYYQNVHMMLNRRPGGWPTSIFSTYDNEPFFAGTYIPPKNRDKMLGFEELIKIIATKFEVKDAELFKNAKEIQGFLEKKERPTEAAHITKDFAHKFLQQASKYYDTENGGFSVSPKFPQTAILSTLLQLHQLLDSKEALDIVTHTLDNMCRGGMYDLIDGGFCRYSVDKEWLVPHFEKMTYDNALLAEVYLNAFKITKNENYKTIADETIDFMTDKMMQNNLFYSASDADTDGVEGKYFVYDYEEVNKLIGSDATAELSITVDGNFEGTSIARINGNERGKNFEKSKKILKNLRSKRTYPFIDKKVLVTSNAMMIKTLFIALHPQAELSLSELLNKMYIDGKLYHSALIDKTPKIEAFLEDYAYLAQALITAFTYTQNKKYLALAQQLATDSIAKFFKEGRWLFGITDIVTEADINDSGYPAAVSVMIEVLFALGVLIDPKYTLLAKRSLEFYSLKLVKNPFFYARLSSSALHLEFNDLVVKTNLNEMDEMQKSFTNCYYPFLYIKKTSDSNSTLCSAESCFAKLETQDELINIIKNYLKGLNSA